MSGSMVVFSSVCWQDRCTPVLVQMWVSFQENSKRGTIWIIYNLQESEDCTVLCRTGSDSSQDSSVGTNEYFRRKQYTIFSELSKSTPWVSQTILFTSLQLFLAIYHIKLDPPKSFFFNNGFHQNSRLHRPAMMFICLLWNSPSISVF